jgi:hypothetical protein
MAPGLVPEAACNFRARACTARSRRSNRVRFPGRGAQLSRVMDGMPSGALLPFHCAQD